MKRTKIIATIGPASREVETLVEMIKAGVNVARLNFSHGSYASHAKLIQNIRQASKITNTPIGIIQDLSGPKLRLGEFEDLELHVGDHVVLGNSGIPVQRTIWNWIKAGQTILLDDGLIELLATKTYPDSVEAKVIIGGKVISHKGVSLPGVKMELPILSEKDLDDLEFGIKSDVDFVALSFVKTDKDIARLRKAIKKYTKKNIPVISKIETPEAIKNMNKIIEASDVIMVARGDLALNMPQASTPVVEKEIVEKCVNCGTPVIMATEMLGSMTRNPRPTRAELSDVANAVIDHVDCLMLATETAFGNYPVKTVATMRDIIEKTEESPLDDYDEKTKNKLIHQLHNAHLRAVVVDSLEMANRISRFRVEIEIIFLSKSKEHLRLSSILWGVTPVFLLGSPTKVLKEQGLIKKGQKYLNASKSPSSVKVLSMG
jgi:pyruvate kinase